MSTDCEAPLARLPFLTLTGSPPIMDELQARMRALRLHQAENNPARQPLQVTETEVVDPDVGDEKHRMDVMEPSRRDSPGESSGSEGYTGDAVIKQARRQSKSSSKRKAKQTTVAKALAPTALRQLRGESQLLAMDELQRLEAQAERINQLLAERALRQRQSVQDGTYMGVAVPAAGAAVVPVNKSSRPSADARVYAAKGLQPIEPSHRGGAVVPMPSGRDVATESLKMQAERIQQILVELEATIQQADVIAQEASQPQSQSPNTLLAEPIPQSHIPPSHTTHYQPLVTGIHQSLTSEAVASKGQEQIASLRQDLWRQDGRMASQEAEETAQALRSLANRERLPGSNDWHNPLPRRRQSRTGKSRLQRLSLKMRQFLQVPEKPIDRLGDAALWVVLAAVVRVSSRFLLVVNPSLAPMLVALMVAPAMLAVYLAVFVPKAGLISVYRLFLITLGLLCGGRF